MAVLVLPIGLALEALAGALLIAAAVSLAIFTRDLFSRLPWPLFLIAEATYAAVIGTIGAVVSWSVAGAQNAAQSLRALIINPTIQLLHTSWAIGDIAASLQAFRQVWFPYYAALAESYAWGWVQTETAARQAAVSDLFWTAYNWVQGVYQFAQAGIAGALAAVATTEAQLVQYAQQLYQAAVSHADVVGAQAVAHADQLAQQDVAYAQAVGQEALAYTQQVGLALEGELGLAEQLLRQELAAGDQATAGYAQQLAAIVGAYAASRANALAVAVSAIEDSPCQRLCSPLGQLGQAVQDLEQLQVAELLLQLAAQGIRDPTGTAKQVDGLFGPLVTDTAGLVRQGAGL